MSVSYVKNETNDIYFDRSNLYFFSTVLNLFFINTRGYTFLVIVSHVPPVRAFPKSKGGKAGRCDKNFKYFLVLLNFFSPGYCSILETYILS